MSADENKIHIEPVSFKPSVPRKGPGGKGLAKLLGSLLTIVLLLAVAGAVWFVFSARRVTVTFSPEPDRWSLDGGFTLKLGSQLLAQPGAYRLRADKQGYEDVAQAVEITGEKEQQLTATLKKLPGRVTITAQGKRGNPVPAIVEIDGQLFGKTPIADLSLPAGVRSLKVSAERYLSRVQEIEVEGMGHPQHVNCTLDPGWAEVQVDCALTGAVVSVNGEVIGPAPQNFEWMPGTYELAVSAELYKAFTTQLVAKANTEIRIDNILLKKADGRLVIHSTPSGASVTVSGAFAGSTPLQVQVAPNQVHQVFVTKSGYASAELAVTLKPGEEVRREVTLVGEQGVVIFRAETEATEVWVNGKSWGATPAQMELTAVRHELEFRKEGFKPQAVTLTPRVDFPQEVVVKLAPIAAPPAAVAPPTGPSAGPAAGPVTVIKAGNGYELVRIEPSRFTMGASRREQGRRSNETLREVELVRPFYMGTKEVTNKTFREFNARHNSETIRTYSLNDDEQPVVNLTFKGAAAFCNWLSKKDGLPVVYDIKNGKVVANQPVPSGYRLPTEAEWAYCARVKVAAAKPLKYSWGPTFPPFGKAGNFADVSARPLLANLLKTYDDGFVVAAPPGSFPPNERGLYDMAGNVCEWCHDYYTIYASSPGKVYRDPTGSDEGEYRIIRGSSWKHSSISALRLSYRDYGDDAQNDVGFRVARYADELMGEE